MKKVFAIACLLVVLVSAVAVAQEPANQNAWRLYLKATNPIGSYAAGSLTMATATNAGDGFGTGDTAMGFTSFQPTAACVAGAVGSTIASVDAKSVLAPTNSAYAANGFEKVWDFRVGAFSGFVGPTIKLTMTAVSSGAGIPPASGSGIPPYKYFIRMVDNKEIADNDPMLANGKMWEITMPVAYTAAPLWTLNLPTMFVSKDAAGMSSGYQMQFVQTAVPEPGTVAAALALLAPAGLMFRRRR